MWPAITRWFTDPDTFFGSLSYLRGLLFSVGTMASSGVLDLGPAGWWVGLAAQMASLFMASGERNNLTAEEAARIKSLLENRLK